jgi:murein L,D-transpeptidase YcbB/YkuD
LGIKDLEDMMTGASRDVIGALAAVAILTVVTTWPDTARADSRDAAFRQAVAEASSGDREIAEYYRDTGYQPIWTGDGETPRARRQALVKALSQAGLHGLPETRHDSDGLMARMSQVRSLRDLGQAEVSLTRAYLDYARAVQSGVLVPARVDTDIKRTVTERTAAAHLDALKTGTPHRVLRALPPQTNEYARLMKEKLRLERGGGLGGDRARRNPQAWRDGWGGHRAARPAGGHWLLWARRGQQL